MLFVFFGNTGVQHDFHIRLCLCRLIVTRRVPPVEQDLLIFQEHDSPLQCFMGVLAANSFVSL